MKAPQEEKDKLLTVAEAAKLLRCGKSAIHNHIKNNTLPFSWVPTLGGQRLIRLAVIEEWLKKREIPAGARHGNI